MNLREAGIREKRALLISAISGGDIAAARIRRKIKNVAISAGGEHDSVRRMPVDFSGDQVARDDSFGMSVDQDEIEHLRLRKHLDRAGGDLSAKRLITAEQKLLPGLAACVERARNLRAAEGAIGQQAAIFARKRNALRDALIDDVIADFGQAINVGFAGTKIAAFDRVVEKAVNAVAIVLVIFRRIDSALGRDAECARRG